jgi:hypothetical protein
MFFDGSLSDYRVWNSALNSTQINSNITTGIASGTSGCWQT